MSLRLSGLSLLALPIVSLASTQTLSLEEIVVTAQHRQQLLLEVPVAITVLDGEQLAAATAGLELDQALVHADAVVVVHEEVALGELGDAFDGNLRRRDLRSGTPYNTYTRHGLPPTPIALPSRAALFAAVQPADGDALFFVSRGDGSHEFTSNLRDHNRAVARFQLKRR